MWRDAEDDLVRDGVHQVVENVSCIVALRSCDSGKDPDAGIWVKPDVSLVC